MNQVLLISYHYPPSAAVGGVRPAKFTRYLPECGWRPTVLTAGEAGSQITPDIVRVHEWPHPLKAYERYKSQRAKKSGKEAELLSKWNPSYSSSSARPHRKFAGFKASLFAFLRLPDSETGWLVPAVWKASGLIRKEGITHVVTTGPPFSCHLAGLVLKRLTRVRWIVDFQDPWSVQHKFMPWRTHTTDLIEARLIRAVMQNADAVISVTPQMTEHAQKEHAALNTDRFVTIANGFDPEDFSNLTIRPRAAGPILFSYLGTFYYGRTPEPFLTALKSAIDDRLLARADVRVRFVGDVAVAEGQPVREMIVRFGLDDVVTVHPPVSRKEALKQTAESDVVLVLDERHPTQVPMKLYEALAAGPVVLNIGSKGAVSEILAHTGKGIGVDYANTAGIRDAIMECIRQSYTNRTEARPGYEDPHIQHFDFRYLTTQLGSVLDGLVASR